MGSVFINLGLVLVYVIISTKNKKDQIDNSINATVSHRANILPREREI